jgi:hypothetical protein
MQIDCFYLNGIVRDVEVTVGFSGDRMAEDLAPH